MTLPSAISDFLALQATGMLVDFRDDGTTCLIATTPTRIEDHSNLYGWSISFLKGVRPKSALVITKPNGGHPELWVRVNYRGCRRAFLLFLQQVYGLVLSKIPISLQVDHLHPASRFNESTNHYFVRLALIDRSANASFGAGFERLLYARERDRELIGGVHMAWMAYLKILGIRLPTKSSGKNTWTVWAWEKSKLFVNDGFDVIHTYVGLTIMLNLAYENVWRPLPPHLSFRAEAECQPAFSSIPQLSEA